MLKKNRLSLALEAALNENKFVKTELINLKQTNSHLESSLKSSSEKCDKLESTIKKFSSQIEILRLKFKSAQQKLIDIELVKEKVDAKIESLLIENQKLRSILKHNECVVSGLKSEIDTLKKVKRKVLQNFLFLNLTFLRLKMNFCQSLTLNMRN